MDKIVGPGNSFVTLAKKLVAFDCAIDLLAGPTEAVIVSEAGNPRSSPPTWWLKPSTMWMP